MAMTKKTCLVTGCSAGGVGSSLAQTFADNGYHVFATARTPSKISTSLRAASNVTVLALDVTSTESIAAAVEAVEKQAGKLDVLINNAGLGSTAPALDTPLDEARDLVNLNFISALAMIQAFRHLLVKAKGCVVNNTSVGALIPFPFSSIYNAAKAALMEASETWRLELAPLGVRTITLVTGGIDTNFFNNLKTTPTPKDSYYRGIEDIINKQLERNPYAMKPEVFAEKLLRRVENKASGKVWIGGGVGLVRAMLWLFPSGLVDMFIENMKPFSKKLEEFHNKSVVG